MTVLNRGRTRESRKTQPNPGMKRADAVIIIILLLLAAGAAAAIIYVIVTPKQGERFTEFYILGPGGVADDYPTSLETGGKGSVIIGVVNHEHGAASYRLEADYGGLVLKDENITLRDGGNYTENFSFTPVVNGTSKLEFQLYKEGSNEPYRELYLWVTAT